MNNKNLTIEETFDTAYQNHKKKFFKIAENLYKKVLKSNPNHFGSIFYLGTLLVQTQRFELAKPLLHKATQIKPNYAAAHNNLGATLKELGEYQRAIDCCQKAIQINPNYADAHNNLGAALKELGEYQKVINCCQKAIEINPNLESAYINLGLVFQDLGEMQQALNCYQKLIQIQPSHADAHYNLGRIYVALGDIQKAINSYQEALKYEPENLFYYYHLSDLMNEILNSNLKNKINKIMKESNLTKKNLAYGNFLLSSYELKLKNYEKEFNYLLKGHLYYFESENNKFKRDVKYWLDVLPKTKELVNLNKSNKNIKKNNHILKPIFIVGVPRCGSTLIEKIIASGGQYIPIGEETGVLSTFVKQKIIQRQSLNSKIEDFQIKLFEKYKEKGLVQAKNNYTFTDKTLDNFFYIGLIKQIFPYAKVINCKRDAVFSIMSILKNNLPAVPWAHNLEHIFKYFDIYYQIINNFKKILPNFIYDLEFEKFVNDPENESKKLMKFCGLSWDIKCLEFYKRKDLIAKTSSNLQIRKAIYKHSEKKYLPYKQFLKKYGDKYSWYN